MGVWVGACWCSGVGGEPGSKGCLLNRVNIVGKVGGEGSGRWSRIKREKDSSTKEKKNETGKDRRDKKRKNKREKSRRGEKLTGVLGRIWRIRGE